MSIKPVIFLTTNNYLPIFKQALTSCAKIGEFRGSVLDMSTIKCIPDNANLPAYTVQKIMNNLRHTELDIVVDAVALDQALALIGSYINSWGLNDEMINRLYEVVYDPLSPDRAEVLQNIKEALRLVDEYSSTLEPSEQA